MPTIWWNQSWGPNTDPCGTPHVLTWWFISRWPLSVFLSPAAKISITVHCIRRWIVYRLLPWRLPIVILVSMVTMHSALIRHFIIWFEWFWRPPPSFVYIRYWRRWHIWIALEHLYSWFDWRTLSRAGLVFLTICVLYRTILSCGFLWGSVWFHGLIRTRPIRVTCGYNE